MLTLPLLIPDLCEALRTHLISQSGALADTRSPEWNGLWQTARTHANYGDFAAGALVALFLLTLGVVTGGLIVSILRPRLPTREHLLIDEVLDNEDRLASGKIDKPAPWEKPADWWKE